MIRVSSIEENRVYILASQRNVGISKIMLRWLAPQRVI